MKKTRGTIKIVNRNRRAERMMKTVRTTCMSVVTLTMMLVMFFGIQSNAFTRQPEQVETITVTDEVIENFANRRIDDSQEPPEIREYTIVAKNVVSKKSVENSGVKINGGITDTFESMDVKNFEVLEEKKEEENDISKRIRVPKKEDRIYEITEEEYDILCRVVEAEVTGDEVLFKKGLTYEEVIIAKTCVAQVYINRVLDDKNFKDVTTLKRSLTQKNASSTFNDGRYYKVTVTEYTREAVFRALHKVTPNYTKGALFFSAGNGCAKYGTLVYKDKVGHSFYNPYL